MIPGMNPRDMQKAMKKLGIKQEEIDAVQVIIRTENSEFVINNPQVSKVNMMGQDTYQVVGEAVEQAVSDEVEVNEDDVKTVVEQTGVSEEKARETVEKHNGDLAEAIMELSEKNE